MDLRDVFPREDEILFWLGRLKEDTDGLRREAEEKRVMEFSNEISVSLNVFLPVTKQCRNTCLYCGYSRERENRWLSTTHAREVLRVGKRHGCSEALFVSGDAPEKRLRSAREYLARHGVKSLIEYALPLLHDALNNGLLPHVNFGVLGESEYMLLNSFTASMGLMLESTSKWLLEKGGPHYRCPDKVPERRVESILTALRLRIPFTSGLLIGIGESKRDRVESALVLANLARKHGFLQEVIIQPFTPIPLTPMQRHPPAKLSDVLEIVSLLRVLLPREVSVQVPPNLVEIKELPQVFEWGVNDLGGISPVTVDHVNPLSPWPRLQELASIIEALSYQLMIRLPVYPKYYNFVGEKAKVLLDEEYAVFKQNGMLPWRQVLLP